MYLRMSGAILWRWLPEGAVHRAGGMLRLRVLQVVMGVGVGDMGVCMRQTMSARRGRVDCMLNVLRMPRA